MTKQKNMEFFQESAEQIPDSTRSNKGEQSICRSAAAKAGVQELTERFRLNRADHIARAMGINIAQAERILRDVQHKEAEDENR